MTTPKAKEVGLVFPPDPRKAGERGSTYGNKETWANAVQAVDSNEANKIRTERQWRAKYTKYIVKMVELSLKSPKAALAVAQAGLDWAYNNFEFVRDGETMTFQQALDKFTTHKFKTGFIKGTGPKPKFELKVPYKGRELSGQELLDQLNKWSDYGTIEPSARDAIAAVAKNPKWLDLSDSYFVLLGAGSAMGPFPLLMDLGANVIAIDLDREGIWERLIKKTRSSPGTLTFPMKCDMKGLSDAEIAKNAGCNLFTETPEIRNWVLEQYPKEELIVGAYAYLDGELHVKVSLAMDAIIRDVTTKRKGGAAYLCTPTDCHVIPAEAAAAQKENRGAGLYARIAGTIGGLLGAMSSNSRKPVIAENGDEFNTVDALINAQGPNYALAKRMQHWRAILAREGGSRVSSNIAPSTSTVSVTHNKMFALAYKGMPNFKPMEVFAPETSNAVMAALLINDIRNKESKSDPKNKLRNPLELFAYEGFHGGTWRIGWTMDSIGAPSVLAGLAQDPRVVAAVGIFMGWVSWLLAFLPKAALEYPKMHTN